MLLVARRVGEALLIGTNIEVKVVAATRSRVMLAVTAPRELNIRRIYGKSDYKNVSLADCPEGLAAEQAADGEDADQSGESQTGANLRKDAVPSD